MVLTARQNRYCTEKHSNEERADRRRWRMKEGERVCSMSSATPSTASLPLANVAGQNLAKRERATNFGHRNRVEEATPIRRLSCKSFSDNFIFFMEKYSSGDVCERCRWQSKRAIRSGSRRRARANCICEVRCGNGNRIEEATPTPEHSCKMLF